MLQTSKKTDLTSRAVQQQLNAMGCKQFDIGLRHEHSGQMRNFEALTKTDVVKRIEWLKVENLKGHHIYIRPHGSTGLVLVDDISQSTVERMKQERVKPVLVVETSPDNFQAWVRLSYEPISNELATMASKLLAKRYHGDDASADWKHYGRLAGFTNIKPEHVTSQGRYPYVKVNGARTDSMALRAAEILGAAHREIKKVLEARVALKKSQDILTPCQDFEGCATAQYERLSAVIESRYQPNVNYSKLDWMVSCSMLKQGYSEQNVISALILSSKNLEERKGKYILDYATRTVTKASEKINETYV